MTSYNTYKMRVSRSDRLFFCECSTSVSRKPADHARHVYEEHGLNKKTHCPWCRQPFDTNFKGVAVNVPHLSECFDRLLKDVESSEEEESSEEAESSEEESSEEDENSKEESSEKMCEACIRFDSLKERCRFYGRSRLDHPSFYEPFEREPFESHVRFTEASGLGADVAGYIGLEGHVFVHFFVKMNAFDSFTEAMRDSRSVSLLPFSCLCDGGECREDEYRIHRHGIAVCRELKDFREMFGRVRFTTRRHKDQKCKSYVEIKTRHHLCNVINYVGGRKSGCTGKCLQKGKKTDEKKTDKKNKSKNERNHYHIFRPMCPHASLFLHACYEAGPQEYYEQLHGNRDVWDKKVDYEHGKAYIWASELPSDGCRPPLETPESFFLNDGLWTLEGRPISHSRVDLRFFLTSPQTRRARELKDDRKVRTACHDAEKQAMRTENDQKTEELRSEIEILRIANADLRRDRDFKLQLKDLEIKNLKDKLKSEVGHTREISALKTSHHEYVDEMKAMHKEEIKQLYKELQERDAEIKQLYAKIEKLYKELQERDAEIKRLLVDQLNAIVKRNLEDANLREENRQSLIDHHDKIVRLMEDKMELKDKICALFERVVYTWLAPNKRKLDDITPQ